MRALIESIEERVEPLDEGLMPDDVFWEVVSRQDYMVLRRKLRGEAGDDAMLRTILQKLIEVLTPKGNDAVALTKFQNMIHNAPKWDEAMTRNQMAKIADLLKIKAPKKFKELWMKRAPADMPEG